MSVIRILLMILLNDYLNNGWDFNICFLQLNDLYGTKTLINEILRIVKIKDKNFVFGSEYLHKLYSDTDEKFPDEKKINLTKKQTEDVTGKIGFLSLLKYFNLHWTDEYVDKYFKRFTYPYGDVKIPEQICKKANEYIINKEFDKFNDNYEPQWTTFELTQESAKVLFDTNRISFETYKDYIPKEELAKIVEEKTEIVEKLIEEYKENKSRKLLREIAYYIFDYGLSLDLLFKALGKESKYFRRFLKDIMFGPHSFGRRGCGGEDEDFLGFGPGIMFGPFGPPCF